MEQFPNEGDGITVALQAGDDLDAVPASHRKLITPAIREVFADPVTYFADVARRSRFTELRRWLEALLTDPDWELQLSTTPHCPATQAAFSWRSDRVRGALIEPPAEETYDAEPETVREYHSLVGAVDWGGFMAGGGFFGPGGRTPISTFSDDAYGADLSTDDVYAWGDSACGDMLVYTADDRGGWYNHGSRQLHFIGTIEDAINHTFATLCEGQTPEWQSEWNVKRTP